MTIGMLRGVAIALGSGWVVLACSGDQTQTASTGSRDILYSSQQPNGTEDLRAVNPATGATRLVISGDSASSRSLGAWSPDSRSIALVHEYGGRTELVIWNDDEGGSQNVNGALPPVVLFPDWSPDGDQLLVSAGSESRSVGVHLVTPSSGMSRPVRVDDWSYRCPSWSPKGDRFVVAAYANSRSALLVIDTIGGVTDILARSDTTYLDCAQWSPTRDEILLTVFHGGGQSGWERPAYQSSLALLDLRSRQLRQIAEGPGLSNYGRWSPDGEWIVFQSDRHAPPTTAQDGLQRLYRNLEIYIVRRDGSELQRLTANDYFDAHPSW